VVHLVVGVRLRVGLAAPRNNDLPPPAAGILYRIRPFSSSAGAALAAWGSKKLNNMTLSSSSSSMIPEYRIERDPQHHEIGVALDQLVDFE